ncbi:MAG: hypothetical protein AB8G05_07940 [Oligoflexales bacterium]
MFFRLKVQIIFLILIGLLACKKHVGISPNGFRNLGPTLGENEKKIELAFLKTRIKEIKEFTIGEHIGISFELFPTNGADFYRFYLCSSEENKCNPLKSEPKDFYLTTHQFINPPTGKIEVFVASCVNFKKVKNSDRNCGPFTVSAFRLNPSKNTETKELLEEREKIIEKNRENCHDFFDNIEVYYNKMIATHNFAQDALVQAVQKQLDMGKELNCELIYSSVYQDLISEEATESSESSESEKSKVWTPAAITLISLGSISAATGVAYMAKGVYETNFAKIFAKSISLVQAEDDEYAVALSTSKELQKKLEKNLGNAFQELNLASSKDREKHSLLLGLKELYYQQTEAIKKGRARLKANKSKIEKSIR